MVRESLKKFYQKKQNIPREYTGRLSDVSISRCKDGYPILLREVYLTTGERIDDHIWIRLEVLPQTMGLNIGDKIQFTGIIVNYKKLNGSMDFGIDAMQESISKCVEAN